MTNNWIRWVEARLPHVVGADPDDGVGIDCLLMSLKVRESAGLFVPRIKDEWFESVRRNDWGWLHDEWNRLAEKCEIEPYALVLHAQPGGLIGVGVVVCDGVLIVHHQRGVQWLPLAVAKRLIQPLTFWKPKHAAV